MWERGGGGSLRALLLTKMEILPNDVVPVHQTTVERLELRGVPLCKTIKHPSCGTKY